MLHFEEEFNTEQEIEERLLNPNKRNHRKVFVERCVELLNSTPIENEVDCVERHKIEKI